MCGCSNKTQSFTNYHTCSHLTYLASELKTLFCSKCKRWISTVGLFKYWVLITSLMLCRYLGLICMLFANYWLVEVLLHPTGPCLYFQLQNYLDQLFSCNKPYTLHYISWVTYLSMDMYIAFVWRIFSKIHHRYNTLYMYMYMYIYNMYMEF